MKNSTDSNTVDLKIAIFEDLGLNYMLITSKKLSCTYGAFVIPDSEELVKILEDAIFSSNLLHDYSFTEVIQACTFFTDEEKEFYRLKYA